MSRYNDSTFEIGQTVRVLSLDQFDWGEHPCINGYMKSYEGKKFVIRDVNSVTKCVYLKDNQYSWLPKWLELAE